MVTRIKEDLVTPRKEELKTLRTRLVQEGLKELRLLFIGMLNIWKKINSKIQGNARMTKEDFSISTKNV